MVPPAKGRKRRRHREPWPAVLGLIGGAGGMILIYTPIVWLAVMSVSREPLSGVPGPVTFEWYARLFGDGRWIAPLMLSVALGMVVGIVCMIAASVVGRRLPLLRQRGAILLCVLIPLFVPGVVMGTALFLYFRSFLGLRLGLWSILVGHFVWAYPFALLAVVVMATRFDHRLIDAAADLGASRWRCFWDIEFPSLRSGIIAAGLFGFLLSFNELSRSIFLRGRETTLALYSWAQASSHSSNVPLIYALNTLTLIVSLVLIGVAFQLLFGRGRD